MNTTTDYMQAELDALAEQSNLRTIPHLQHEGKYILTEGRQMLNLCGNDYLGIAADRHLREEFLQTLTTDTFMPTSASSRLLTGNDLVYEELEAELASLYGTESALLLNSGYHANTGILPAICTPHTLILADKLVHASLIDGIRLSAPARCIRYRHNDLEQLERLIQQHLPVCDRIVIFTESIFSMDGDCADLPALVRMKQTYGNILLYVDEAHAFGVRGRKGLGLAEETDCMADIDLLVGTFGKAAASMGAFVVCSRRVRQYLINRMRTLIFSTALPPVTMQWTLFVVRRLAGMDDRRAQLTRLTHQLRTSLTAKGYTCPGSTHIVPLITGGSTEAVSLAGLLQRHGFYILPVRPPTVPPGTSRLRFSLSAALDETDITSLLTHIPSR